MRSGRFGLLTLAGALALVGCSERVIATANGDVLVIAEDIHRTTPLAKATVHYLMAHPQPLSDDAKASERVVRMRYQAEFDCSGMAWGERVMDLTMIDGRVVTSQTPEPALEKPSSNSVADSVLRAVCDRDFYRTRQSRRPLRSIEKDYLKRVAAG